MHRSVGNDDECTGKPSKADDIRPQRKIVESESAQNAGAWHFDIKPVPVVFETQLGNLIDNECFVAIVEDGQLERPLA